MRIIAGLTFALSLVLIGVCASYIAKASYRAEKTSQLLLAARKNADEIALVAKNPSTVDIDTDHVSRAQSWYADNGFDLAGLQKLPAAERARLVTALTYRFCDTGNETPSDLNDLYTYCSTQCGGYAYVARGLAEALNLRTRYANLYNIPQQGNHTAVEFEVDGVWEFYDPTFGAFFTDSGEAEGRVLNISEVAGHQAGALKFKVVQIDKRGSLSAPAGYSSDFDHKYMEVDNYRAPEAILQFLPGEMLMLRVPLHTTDAIGLVGETDRSKLMSGWLTYTNKTLNDSDPLNDTSFSSYLLLNSPVQRGTAVRVTGMAPGRYSVKVVVYNPGAPQRMQVSPLGKRTRLLSERIVEVAEGSQLVELEFQNTMSEGTVILRNMDQGVLELYGYDLDKVSEGKDQGTDGVY